MRKMKRVILLAIGVLMLCGTNVFAGNSAGFGYGLVNTEILKKELDAGIEMTVVDVRTPEEFQEVHIPGAINIPLKQWEIYFSSLPANKSTKIVLYCNGLECGKSKKAAKKFIALGYKNVKVYFEGIPVWEEKGMPIYAGPNYEERIETTKITPTQLYRMIKSESHTITVVDVRDPEEFFEGHIPGSINVPVATFASQSGVLDMKKKIIVYCNSGGRSYNAYRKLKKLGFKNINQAIFADWKEDNLPIE